MTEAKGVVTALDGAYAEVRMDEVGCGRCHEEGGCGGTNLATMLCRTPRVFRVLNPGGTQIGDHVTVVVAAGAVRRTALLAYGLPLAALFLGAFVGSAFLGDLAAIAGALVGLLGGWGVAHAVQRGRGLDVQSQPYIRH